jgi:hypothetical protein
MISGVGDNDEEMSRHVDEGDLDGSLESVRIAMQLLLEDTARGFREIHDSVRATAIAVVSDETGELPSLLAKYGH